MCLCIYILDRIIHTQTHTHTHTHTQTKSGVVGYEDEEMGPVETETECIARRAHTWIAIIGVCSKDSSKDSSKDRLSHGT